MENLITIGVIVIVIGFVLLFIGILSSAMHSDSKVSGGAVVMIGPIPIGFGTDRGALITAMILAVLLMLIYILFFRQKTII